MLLERRQILEEIFKDIEPKQKKMRELKKLPFIRINPKDSSKQESTKAAKQYKDISQSYMNAIRILASLLHKDEGEEEDPVQKFLESRRNV